MNEDTTIRVYKDDRDKLEKLCKRDGIKSYIDYFKAMVEYFDSTGLNPEEKIKSTAGELSKLRNTMVSFIRTQEEKKLDPIMQSIDELTGTLLNFLKHEALNKKDFIGYMDTFKPSDLGGATNSESGQQAKELFEEFISKMSSRMGGYSIDKKTLLHYRNQFAALS